MLKNNFRFISSCIIEIAVTPVRIKHFSGGPMLINVTLRYIIIFILNKMI